jgi:hypothetical protein
MKYLFYILSCLFLLHACTKDNSIATENSFVKTFNTDSDAAVINSFQLADGNVLIVGQDMDQLNPGYAVKLDNNGNALWEKRLSPKNLCIWKAFPLPGIGFATIGYSDPYSTELTICSYNTDGQLVATKTMFSNWDNSSNSPYDVLQLKNGNFAFAGCQSNTFPTLAYVYITDPTFNVIDSSEFEEIADSYGYFFRGICEMPDNTIAITASTTYIYPNFVDSGVMSTILLRTNLNGKKISEKIIIDTLYNVTPNVLLRYRDGMLSISGRMQGFNSGNGVIVNYVNNSIWGQLISGGITLTTLDSAGQILKRISLYDYPGNGMISSAKATNDGGFILCGIVNQSDQPSISSNTKIYLSKLDADLNQQWTKIIKTPAPSYGIDVLQTNDGGYLVSGYQKSLNEHFIMMAIKTDASGNTN